jgi:ABC-2 type transport system permease protein
VSNLVGTGSLVRLILRRDRLRLAVWVVLLALVPLGTACAFIELYPDAASREQLAATVS